MFICSIELIQVLNIVILSKHLWYHLVYNLRILHIHSGQRQDHNIPISSSRRYHSLGRIPMVYHQAEGIQIHTFYPYELFQRIPEHL